MNWEYGQLHQEQRALGCQDLWAVFQPSEIAPNIKQTIAENLYLDHAIAISKLPQVISEIEALTSFLESVMKKYERKTVEEFADGYYSSSLATYNRMFLLRQMVTEIKQCLGEQAA